MSALPGLPSEIAVFEIKQENHKRDVAGQSGNGYVETVGE